MCVVTGGTRAAVTVVHFQLCNSVMVVFIPSSADQAPPTYAARAPYVDVAMSSRRVLGSSVPNFQTDTDKRGGLGLVSALLEVRCLFSGKGGVK